VPPSFAPAPNVREPGGQAAHHHGVCTKGSLTPEWIEAAVHAELSRRLSTRARGPVAVAFSGGGDSLALLMLTRGWAAANGREILALSVDHGLNPRSGAWMAWCEARARSLGVLWQGLKCASFAPAVGGWASGLQARARDGRLRLICEAAREAGARIVLTGHTCDDVRESALMIARAEMRGRLRPVAPAPVWPEGRGLLLVRPLLDVSRADLRHWLTARGADWIDDPANEDARFARVRARADLGAGEGAPPLPDAPGASLVLPALMSLGAAWFCELPGAESLAHALVAVAGHDRLPRGRRLAALLARMRQGEGGTLAGARVEPWRAGWLLTRERGRGPGAHLALAAGETGLFEGVFEITAHDRPITVARAGGHLRALLPEDRGALQAYAPSIRAALPVAIGLAEAPVLAWHRASVQPLVPLRLTLAAGVRSGAVASEDDLARASYVAGDGGLLTKCLSSELASWARSRCDSTTAKGGVIEDDNEPA
jgi:tRNA(Ile)-lysidine synthase